MIDAEDAKVKNEAIKEIDDAYKKADEDMKSYFEANKSQNEEKEAIAEKNKDKAIAGVIKLLF